MTFLGTSATFPTERRNHPGIFIEFLNEGILLDCGENIQRQMRIAKISPTKITKILITHWHGDHVLGLPGILQSLENLEYSKTLEIYGPEGIKNKIELLLETFDIFLSFNIKITELKKNDDIIKFFENREYELYYTYGEHFVNVVSYSFKEKDKVKIDKEKLYSLGIKEHVKLKELKKGKAVKINNIVLDPKEMLYLKKGLKITYITDTVYKENLKKLADFSDILIIECMYSSKEKELSKKHMHLSSEDVKKIALNSRIKFILHFSQRYEKNLKTLLEDLKEIDNVFLSEDFLKVNYVKDIIEIIYKDGSKFVFKRNERTGEVTLIS